MKKLLLALFFSTQAFATGSVSIEPRYDFYSKDSFYVLSLSVWEPISKKVAYNGWLGVGDDLDKETHINDRIFQNWIVAKNQLDIKAGKVTLSPGFRVQYNDNVDTEVVPQWLDEAFLKISYKLW